MRSEEGVRTRHCANNEAQGSSTALVTNSTCEKRTTLCENLGLQGSHIKLFIKVIRIQEIIIIYSSERSPAKKVPEKKEPKQSTSAVCLSAHFLSVTHRSYPLTAEGTSCMNEVFVTRQGVVAGAVGTMKVLHIVNLSRWVGHRGWVVLPIVQAPIYQWCNGDNAVLWGTILAHATTKEYGKTHHRNVYRSANPNCRSSREHWGGSSRRDA